LARCPPDSPRLEPDTTPPFQSSNHPKSVRLVPVAAIRSRPTDKNPRERQPVLMLEPLAHFLPAREAIRHRERSSRNLHPEVDRRFRQQRHAVVGDFDAVHMRDDSLGQQLLLASIGLVGPCTEADSVASFRHPFRCRPHGLRLLSALDEFRELRLEHPHERGRTRRFWTTPTSFLVGGALGLRWLFFGIHSIVASSGRGARARRSAKKHNQTTKQQKKQCQLQS